MSKKPQVEDPRVIKDDTPFPVPELYFRVFDSEKDEPESKIRADVNKLYERWQEKHGRRWPDHGLNTEDLVWLQEESTKAKIQLDEDGKKVISIETSRPGSLKGTGYAPVEKAEYDNEFISEVDEEPGAGAAGTSAKAANKARRKAMSNYEATVAGGNWVTDEFESEEYEAGNMEQLWNMYLWDREGKPTMMPDGPPDEAQGEESEEWDDFYGSYRPRYVNSEEAREAVWATDEFESDEDNTESEWEPEYVGAGLGLDHEDPINPQYSLRHSNHPLAPFPGDPLKWSSYVYDDGTTFEGLSREAVPHGMGVLVFGNGTGGGFHFRDVRRGDKYEGEFQAGYAHGLGQFTSEMNGEVYIGEFFAGQRHGCGIKINMQPFYYLLERGDDPVSAYQKTYDQIMRHIEFRTWYRNRPLGSDYEDETVLYAVREDMANPYDVVLQGSQHEQKLKDWKKKDEVDKALTKMVEIIEQVGGDRMARRQARFGTPDYYRRDEDGELREVLDSEGNDTAYDSMDLMLGNNSEGGPGLGWMNDSQDTEEYPYDDKLLASIEADVIEDKAEESEDKQMVLGDDLVNPFTGLNLKDYLDGKEGKYHELMLKNAGVANGSAAYGKTNLLTGYPSGAFKDPEDSSWVDELDGVSLDTKLSKSQMALLVEDMERKNAIYGDGLGRDPLSEHTDTRFETESDMMELCDLAEILGTVDEATEIVQKARMWRWKPEGEVTLRFAQDGQGAPVNLMQDPLHFPHGTKFMAPGPLGQCHPLPDDKNIRVEMTRVAHNYKYIYEKYNFDYDPEPGSVQYKIDQRIKRAQELRMQSLARMAEAAEEELQQPALLASVDGVEEAATSGAETGPSSSGFRGFGFGQRPGSVFASMSFGMGRASHVILNALSHAAKHAPARRPKVMRPSAMRKGSKQQGRV